MSHRILPRFVITNERGTKNRCQICDVRFQLLVKQEHQCKRCLRLICEDCGPQRRIVYEFDGSWAEHRCCLVCIKQIENMQQYQNTFKLCLGQDSEFVQDWINKLNKQHKQYDEILNQYTDNVTMVTTDNTIRFKRDSQSILKDLIDSCHYSFRHFLYMMTNGVKKQIFDNKVIGVMVGVYARVKALPYIPELVYVAAFFLCFASEAHSYFIVTRLIEKVYPQYVRVKKLKKDNLLTSSLKTILQMYRICVDRVDRNQLQVIAQYLENRFEHFIISFTLNVCSMPSSFFILDQMLKSGNYLALYKGIAALLSNCREELSAYQSFSQVQIPMLRQVSLQKLKTTFVKFQKTDIKFQVSNDVFDSAEHRKLYQKYKQMESLYGKLQANLNEKQQKLKQMSERLSKKGTQLDEQTKKVSSLQTQLISLSEHIPHLVNYNQMEEQNKYAVARNAELERKCEHLELQIERFQKQKAKYEKMNRMWSSLQKDYIEQIKNLKTKNQILQIKVAAKEIDFNTSSIERSLNAKNSQNQILKAELTHMKSELEYYKLKVLQHRFSLNHTGKALKLPSNDKKDEEFIKHIKHSNEIVESRTKQLEQKKQQCDKKTQKIKELEGEIGRMRSELLEVQQTSDIIKSIPQQFSYEEAISQLERIAGKQTNFIKKKSLESGIEGFRNCHKQLRFRIIDARIKQQRIKNSPLIKLLNPSTYSTLKREEEAKKDELQEVFNMAGQCNANENKNADCRLM